MLPSNRAATAALPRSLAAYVPSSQASIPSSDDRRSPIRRGGFHRSTGGSVRTILRENRRIHPSPISVENAVG